MASLTKKVINGRPYYYLRETARVGGRSKVVRQVYLGRAEDIERRLSETAEPKSVQARSFGAVAAALKLCRELAVAEAIDRAVSDATIARAETEIVRRCIERYEIELRPLIYDTTNFATFIDSANARNTIAQRGHPKGGRRDLRLIGLALCVALDSNIPLCHQPYA